MTDTAAPFLHRLVARVLDLAFAFVLAFVLVFPVAAVLDLLLPIADRWDRAGRTGTTCLFLAYIALELFLLVRRDGQTLGKGLLGLRVVSTRSPGSHVGPLAALTRLVALFLPVVLAAMAGGDRESVVKDVLARIGLASVLVSLVLAVLLRGTLHDHLSGTRVVRAQKRAIAFREDVRMMAPGRVRKVG